MDEAELRERIAEVINYGMGPHLTHPPNVFEVTDAVLAVIDAEQERHPLGTGERLRQIHEARGDLLAAQETLISIFGQSPVDAWLTPLFDLGEPPAGEGSGE